MQILALEKELKAIDARKHAEVLRQEAAAVWALKKRSVIRVFGSRSEGGMRW